jgi:hypothetical protein
MMRLVKQSGAFRHNERIAWVGSSSRSRVKNRNDLFTRS